MITYCCYGAYADVGHSAGCPKRAAPAAESFGGSSTPMKIAQPLGDMERDGLTSRAAPTLSPGWLPINTAPKDGTEVLLLVPHRLRAGRLLRLTGRWFDRYWITFNADEAIQRVEPTGWMPLPPLPAD